MDAKLDELMKLIMNLMDFAMRLRSDNSEILTHFRSNPTPHVSTSHGTTSDVPWMSSPSEEEGETMFNQILHAAKMGNFKNDEDENCEI